MNCSGNQGVCNMGGCQNGACGKLGQACCGGGVDCTQAFTECRNNQCTACGHQGERCCPALGNGPDTCDVGRQCANGMCQ
jgi:hypothetical protein